ncbi:MAG: diaminopimelate epimerase [Flavobacteriales bacterium TMED123]|nr:MAG: diaminopimelate epimerase [Flavobacteriales bacterium TMED123]
MIIEFYKYQGTGNDFIIIDDRYNEFNTEDSSLIAALCERRMGIGADGLILLRNHATSDFEMIYFNADGKQSSMCGNGGRCIVAFAQLLEIFDNSCSFMAIDGIHQAKIIDNEVALQMKDVNAINRDGDAFVLDTGSPHYISFVENIDAINVQKQGAAVRHSATYKKEGVNVNFVQLGNPPKMRTYERGVENETLSCGTGTVATAIALDQIGEVVDNLIEITTGGGNLSVSFELFNNTYRNIWLSGPAEVVYMGEFAC